MFQGLMFQNVALRRCVLVSSFLLILSGCGGSGGSQSGSGGGAPVANAGGPYTGTTGTALSFSGGGSSDPGNQTLTYAWDFGDSTGGTGASPSHTYASAGTYTAKLTVTNTSKLTASATAQVTVTSSPQPPTANAGGPYVGLAGASISLSGSGSSDPGNQTLTYAWDFGDSTSGTGVSPSHTYASAGTYTAKLTVTNTSKLTASATAQVTVTSPQPPAANAGGPYVGVAGASVSLSGSGSADPQGEALTYAWDFGDGGTGTSATPAHTYTSAGSYTVKLSVTNTSNLTAMAGTTATVTSATLAINSITSSNPIPLTPILISVSGLVPSANTNITFADGAGYTFSESPIRVASDGTIVAATPLYYNSAGATAAATLQVAVSDSGKTTPAVSLEVQDLPTVASYGVQPGDLTSALLVYQSLTTARAINGMQAAKGAAGNKVDATASIAALQMMSTGLTSARSNVNQIVHNQSLSIPQGTLSDGTSISMDAHTLDLMDRVAGVLLAEQFGQVAVTAGARSGIGGQLHVFAKVKGQSSKRTARSAAGRNGLGARHATDAPQANATVSGASVDIASALLALNSAKATYEVAKGMMDAMKAAQQSDKPIAATILDEVSAIAGGVGSLADLGYGKSDPRFAGLVGAYAGAVSNVNTVVNCLTDDGLYLVFKATGQDGAAAEVVADMESMGTEKLAGTLESLLVAAVPESAIVSKAGTLFDMTTKVVNFLTADSTTNTIASVYETAMAIEQEGSELFPTGGNEGIAVLEGSVETGYQPKDPDPTPELGIDINPAPGGDSDNTVADPGGNYLLLAPVDQQNYDYSNVSIEATDTTTDSSVGNEKVDLAGDSYGAVLVVPEIKSDTGIVSVVVAFNGWKDQANAESSLSLTVDGYGS